MVHFLVTNVSMSNEDAYLYFLSFFYIHVVSGTYFCFCTHIVLLVIVSLLKKSINQSINQVLSTGGTKLK